MTDNPSKRSPFSLLKNLATMPKAVLLRRRFELQLDARRQERGKDKIDRPKDLNSLFARAMYPTTMGPDEAVDRMGYGDTIGERRGSAGQERIMLRTRSGTLPVDPSQDPDAKKDPDPK